MIHWTDEMKATARKLWTVDGYSASQIAKEIGNGLSKNAVISAIKRMGLLGHGTHRRTYVHHRKHAPVAAPKPKTKVFINATSILHKKDALRREAKAERPRAILPHNLRAKREARKNDPGHVEPPRPTAEPTPLMVPLVELERKHCRWPIGDPLVAGFGFCGHDRTDGSSYCEFHQKHAFLPGINYRGWRSAA